jgi:O-antigen/teichoic acid export membrane protein
MVSIIPQGLLFGANRYEIANAWESLAQIGRLLLIVILFETLGPSLALIGAAILAVSIVRTLALFTSSLLVTPTSRIFSLADFDVPAARSIATYSSWTFLGTLAGLGMAQGPVLIIGKCLSVELVAAFAPAMLVSTSLQGLLSSLAKPLVPLASGARSSDRPERLGELSIDVAQMLACIGLSVLIPLVVFGPEWTTLWVGDALGWTWPLIAIMALGTVLAQTQAVTYFLALGGGNIRPLILSQIAVAFVICLGTWLGIQYAHWNIFHVVSFIVLCKFVRNVVYLTSAYATPFRYRWATYINRVYVIPTLVAGCCLAIGLGAKHYLPVSSLPWLVAQSMLLLGLFSAGAWLFALGPRQQKICLSLLKRVTG